jgi:hypothetical protein
MRDIKRFSGYLSKTIILVACILTGTLFSSCDPRTETAKKGVEKFVSSPTPPIAPSPTPTPVDLADVVEVDTSQEGKRISIAGNEKRTSVTCTKFDRVFVNGNRNEVTVKGVCRQIMVNGDANNLNIDAAAEFEFNGSDNELNYSRYPNGKQPIVIESRPGNVIKKVPLGTMTNQDPKRKIVK